LREGKKSGPWAYLEWLNFLTQVELKVRVLAFSKLEVLAFGLPTHVKIG
jgi:hypothetical protein